MEWQGLGELPVLISLKNYFFFHLKFANLFVYLIFFSTIDSDGRIRVTAGKTSMWGFTAGGLELILSITEDISAVGVRDGNCMGDASWLGEEEIVGNSISKLIFVVSSSTAASSPTSSF